MKKHLFVGIVVAILLWLITFDMILFERIDQALHDILFYLREPDVEDFVSGERKNPYSSESIKVIGIDDKSLGAIGKWPWYRDIHARYLKTIEKFSPTIVHFDFAFIMPETIPNSLRKELESNPEQLNQFNSVFQSLDNQFADALKQYDNVLVDLFLIPEKRPEIGYLDRIERTETVMERYSHAATDSEMVFHSLEPVLDNFMENARPVTVNQLPDFDGTVRNYLLVHPYETSKGKKRLYFSSVLTMLMKYYRIQQDAVEIKSAMVIFDHAKVPVLDSDQQPKIFTADFTTLKDKITPASKSKNYNDNLYNYLVNEFTVFYPDAADKTPYYPIHLLHKDREHYELLDGREIYDAAVALESRQIHYVLYHEKTLQIRTSSNHIGIKHFLPINYAGRQQIPYTGFAGVRKNYHPMAFESYLDVYSIGELPDIPKAGEDNPQLQQKLIAWFGQYCNKKYNALLRSCQQAYGELTQEKILQYVINDNTVDGKFFFYKIFFDEVEALVQQRQIEKPRDIGAYIDFYQQWVEAAGLSLEKEYLLSQKQMLSALQDVYGEGFHNYYAKYICTGAHSLGMADDIKLTPYNTMFGINIIANAFSTVVTENYLRRSSYMSNLGLLFGLCIVLSLIYARLNIKTGLVFFIASIIGIFVLSYFLFSHYNYMLKTVPLLLADLGMFVSIITIKLLTEEKDKKFLRDAFSQYISPELIDIMYAKKLKPQLGGTCGIITAYFTDIQGFSTFSEKLTASQLVELLNEYLSDMTEILLHNQGTLDKYEGDAIIAFFGAPMFLADHSYRACRTAVEMQNRLAELREKWSQEKSDANRNVKKLGADEWAPGDKWPKIVHQMRMRIGINTGEIVVGNMGSRTRMNYTMMGDAVNLAARLEAGAKQYGVYTMASAATLYQQFSGENNKAMQAADMLECRFLDLITVVGKSEPVKVYEVIAFKGILSDNEQKLLALFAEGMKYYHEMQWDQARAKFQDALQYELFPNGKTTPSQVFITRCEMFKANPPVKPGEKWDGVYRLTSK